jgi:hypothetical protein
MPATAELSLSVLYRRDETAWLDAMAEIASGGRRSELDLPSLSEYLTDMARRDRREVFSRLAVLLTHLLKWEVQAERQSPSWRATIREQRRELRQLLESSTLRAHSETVLADAFQEARLQAADETELPPASFPAILTRSLDEVLEPELLNE